MNITNKFLDSYNNGDCLTAKNIFDWYAGNKDGAAPAYYSNIFQTVITPLIKRGILEKVSKGVYQVVKDEYNYHKSDDDILNELDDWDRYIDEKLK